MPELVFDGRKVTVPEGAHLVDAGLAAGIQVPVFCYQKDLGAVGSCRVCAVTATKEGKSKLVMACMTKAEDGLEVTTTDDGSAAYRKRVIEWLMIHHPHDCPICDEGGECQLQDLTIACGHGRREYSGRKRTFRNQDLGAFIAHEMNRCITCYRCSRFYQEYAGGRDFSATGSRDRVYFGRFEDGPLESPFSGNLVELCPTGVFTDRLFRYRSRVWDLEIGRSVCPHCSVGCNVLAGSRYRELQRVRVRENPEVNGAFLCDRGQFGHGWNTAADRPREPRVNGETVAWEDALGRVGGWLAALAGEHGAKGVALVASPRASLETHEALEALASGPLEGARVHHFDDPEREARAIAAARLLARAGLPPLEQPDIARADVLLIAGASLVDEAPLAALAARQAARRGGKVFVLGPLERYLNLVAEAVVPVHPADLGHVLNAITGTLAARGRSEEVAIDGVPVAEIAAALREAKRPALLAGSDLVDGPALDAAARLARALARDDRDARWGALFPGPNGFGAAVMSAGAGLADTLEAIERGEVRAVVAVESDLADLGPQARDALAKLDLLVVADHLPHGLGDAPHAELPVTTTYESSGTYVNRAGRLQGFGPAQLPGDPVPLRIVNERFPRDPRTTPPHGDVLPAWRMLERLRARAGGRPGERGLDGVHAALAARPGFERIAQARPGATGVPMEAGTWASLDASASASAFARDDGYALFRLDRTLGSERLSRRSDEMRAMAGAPVARISSADPEAPGAGGRVRIEWEGGAVEVAAIADDTVPRGVVLLPRDAGAGAPQGAAVRVRVLERAEAGR